MTTKIKITKAKFFSTDKLKVFFNRASVLHVDSACGNLEVGVINICVFNWHRLNSDLKEFVANKTADILSDTNIIPFAVISLNEDANADYGRMEDYFSDVIEVFNGGYLFLNKKTGIVYYSDSEKNGLAEQAPSIDNLTITLFDRTSASPLKKFKFELQKAITAYKKKQYERSLKALDTILKEYETKLPALISSRVKIQGLNKKELIGKAFNLRGVVRQELKREGFVEDYDKACALKDFSARVNLIEYYCYTQGDFQKVIDLWQSFIPEVSRIAFCYLKALGFAYLMSGQKDKAISEYEYMFKEPAYKKPEYVREIINELEHKIIHKNLPQALLAVEIISLLNRVIQLK